MIFSSFPRLRASSSSGSHLPGGAAVPRPGAYAGFDFVKERAALELDKAVQRYAAATNLRYGESLAVLTGGAVQLERAAAALAQRSGLTLPRARGVLSLEVQL